MPDWDGCFETTAPDRQRHEEDTTRHAAQEQDRPPRRALEAVLTAASVSTSINAMGQPDSRHLAHARNTLDALPDSLYQAAHEPYSARALMYALLLSDEEAVVEQQLHRLEQMALPDVYRALRALAPEVRQLDVSLRLPLIELALPALKSLSLEQVQHFRRCIEGVIEVDGQTHLFEWSLHQLLINYLSEQSDGPARLPLSSVTAECRQLLGVLAAAGQDDAAEVQSALKAAENRLPFELEGGQGVDTTDMQALSMAVERLRRLKPLEKQKLLQAMAACIEHSGHIRPAEAELMRVIAEIMGCPMPPLLTEEDD